jgi:glycerol kinase
VRRAATSDTTALGAAYLAGLACGFWKSREELSGRWKQSAFFEPRMKAEEKEKLYSGWQKAASRALRWADAEE